MKKRLISIIVIIVMNVCAACGGRGHKRQGDIEAVATYPGLEKVGIYTTHGVFDADYNYDALGGVVPDSIRIKLDTIRLSIVGDTAIINGRYKARFKFWEFPIDKFFDHRQTVAAGEFYMAFFASMGADIGETISFLDFAPYPDYEECGFPYFDFFEPGSSGFVYEPPYVFIAYKWYRVCYKIPPPHQQAETN